MCHHAAAHRGHRLELLARSELRLGCNGFGRRSRRGRSRGWCGSCSGRCGDGRGLRLGSCRRRRCRCGLGDRDRLRCRRRCYLDRRRRSRHGRRCGCRTRLDERQDVLLRHPAARTRAGHRGRIDAVLGGDAGDHRRHERPAVLRGSRRHGCCGRSGGRLGLHRLRGECGRHGRDRLGLGRSSGGSGSGLGCGRRGLGWSDLGAGRGDDREHRSDLDGLALLHQDLRDDAVGRARHLGVDLVRGDLEERLVALDRVAHLLEPLRDRSLGDRDAHLGHHDLGLRSGAHIASLQLSTRPVLSMRSRHHRLGG